MEAGEQRPAECHNIRETGKLRALGSLAARPGLGRKGRRPGGGCARLPRERPAFCASEAHQRHRRVRSFLTAIIFFSSQSPGVSRRRSVS